MSTVQIADLAVRLSANAGPLAQAAAQAAKAISEIEKQSLRTSGALGGIGAAAAVASASVAKFSASYVKELARGKVAADQTAKAAKQMADDQARSSQQMVKAAQAVNRAFDLGRLVATGAVVKRVSGEFHQLASNVFGAGGRIQELDAVLGSLAAKNNTTLSALRGQAKEIQKLGIVYSDAQDAVTQFMKAGLPIGQSSKLARVAQDSAVLAGTSSTEAFTRLIYGIQTRQVDVIRTAGLNVNFEGAYAKYATNMKKSVTNLTEAEKAQIALNAVLDAGKGVAGAYEAAMSTANKQLRSTPRYIADLTGKLSLGLTPAFTAQVESINLFLHKLNEIVDTTGITGRLRTGAEAVAGEIADGSKTVLSGMDNWLKGEGARRLRTGLRSVLEDTKKTGLTGLAAATFAIPQAIGRVPGLDMLGVGGLSRSTAAAATLVAGNKDLRDAAGEVTKAVGQIALAASKPLTDAMTTLNKFLAENADTVGKLATSAAMVVEQYAKIGTAALGLATGPLEMLTTVAGTLASALDAVGAGSIAAHGGMTVFMAMQIRSFVADMASFAAKAMLMYKAVKLFKSQEVQEVLSIMRGGVGQAAAGNVSGAAGMFGMLGAPRGAPVPAGAGGSKLRSAVSGGRNALKYGTLAFGGTSPSRLMAVAVGEAEKQNVIAKDLGTSWDLIKSKVRRSSKEAEAAIRTVQTAEEQAAAAATAAGGKMEAAHLKAAAAAKQQAATVSGAPGSAGTAATGVIGQITQAASSKAAAAGAEVGSRWRNALTKAANSKSGAAMSQVANTAFSGLSSYSSILAGVGPASIAATAAITALTLRFQHLSSETAKAREEAEKLFNADFKKDPTAALSRLSDRYQAQTAKLRQSMATYNEQSFSGDYVGGLTTTLEQARKNKGKGGLFGRAMGFDASLILNAGQAVGLESNYSKQQRQLENLDSLVKKVGDDMVSASEQAADKWRENMAATSEAGEKAFSAIKARLGDGGDFLGSASPFQQQQFQGLLTEWQQTVKTWSQSAPSLFTALQDKELRSADGLTAFYRQKMMSLKGFDSGIRELMNAGLNAQDLRELVQAGPEAAGEAMLSIFAQGTDGMKQYVAMANEARTEAAKVNDELTNQLARKEFMQSLQAPLQAAKDDIDELISSLSDKYKAVKDQVSGMASEFDGLNVLAQQKYAAMVQAGTMPAEVLDDHIAMAADQVRQYKEQYQKVVDAILAGGNEQQLTAYLGKVQQFADQAAAVSGEQGAAVVKNQMATLQQMAKLGPQIAELTQLVGVDAAAGLAEGLKAGDPQAMAAGLRQAQKYLEGTLKGLEAARQIIMQKMAAQENGFAQLIGLAKLAQVEGNLLSYQGQVDQTTETLKKLQEEIDRSDAATAAQSEFMAAHAQEMSDALYPDMAAIQKADEEAANRAKTLADALAKAQIEPLDLFKKAADQTVGVYAQLTQAQDQYADSVESAAQQIVSLAMAGDTGAKAQRQVRSAIIGMVQGIRQQVEVMAEAGQVSKDVGSMTALFNDKVNALTGDLPRLVQGLLDASDASRTLEERVGDAQSMIDKAIGGYMDEADAVDRRKQAYRDLKKEIEDSRSLLTGAYLGADDRDQIQSGVNSKLRDYVKSLKDEAGALAKSGKLGADYASQQAYIKKKLQEAGVQYDEISGQVENYTELLDNVPKEKKSEVQLLIDQAMQAVQTISQSISSIPDKAVSIQVDANTEAARQALEGLDGALQSVSGQYDAIKAKSWDTATIQGRAAQYSADVATWQAEQATLAGRVAVLQAYVDQAAASRMSPDSIEHYVSALAQMQGAMAQHAATKPNPAYYDTGGTLDPGMHWVKNATGGREFILKPDQFDGLIEALRNATANNSGATIENVNIYEQQNPGEWFDRTMWEMS